VRCVLIYNPASGRKQNWRVEQLGRIVDALSGLGHRVELTATIAAGSATLQAKAAVQNGAEIVFACGGDGTMHEVLQGLVSENGEHTASLGIIPLGSANALARHLRLSLDPVKAALQQIHCEPHTIPIGKLAYNGQVRYFAVMAGAGPDGALVYNMLSAHKSSLGRLAYYLRAARLFATRRFDPFEVEYTDAASGVTATRRAVSAIAVRVASLGGLFNKLAGRNSGIHDPHLQLIFLRPPAWFSLPLWFISGWLNLHSVNRFLGAVKVTQFSCRPISDPAPHFQADGELLGRIPVQVSIVQNALRILMPWVGTPPLCPLESKCSSEFPYLLGGRTAGGRVRGLPPKLTEETGMRHLARKSAPLSFVHFSHPAWIFFLNRIADVLNMKPPPS
jgi:diacylglycerol kinase (ATP)